MIDAFFITCCCFLGFSFSVMYHVRKLKKKYPLYSFKEIWGTFANEEWDSFFVSVLIWLSFELAYFIVIYAELKLPAWIDSWGMYVIPFLVQYGGQELAYSILNTSKDVLQKKTEQMSKLN